MSEKLQFEISHLGTEIRVSCPEVNLASDREPLNFSLTIKKVPTPIELGTEIDSVTIDDEGKKIQQLYEEARKLRILPERKRLRPLLALVRNGMDYAYPWIMEELKTTDPERYEWVRYYTSTEAEPTTPLKLSEIIEHGFGICRHMSVTSVALAHEAGLTLSHLSYSGQGLQDNERIKNVYRKDDNQPLFKSFPVGGYLYDGHAWVECLMEEGDWIPVDPTTRLIGDTQDGLDTFNEANYRSSSRLAFNIDGLPNFVAPTYSGLRLKAGESMTTGIISINCRDQTKPIIVSKNRDSEEVRRLQTEYDRETWPKQTSYKGPLDFRVYSYEFIGLHIELINISPIR